MNHERVYSHLPVVLQKAVIYHEGKRIEKVRYNEYFEKTLSESEDRLSWSPDDVHAYVETKLKANLLEWSRLSKYYRNLFVRCGVDLNSFSLSDLSMLPIQTKQDVKDNFEAIRGRSVGGTIHWAHTSGTTGSGLRFPMTQSAYHEQWAVWWRYWRVHGISHDSWCSLFGGRAIVPIRQSEPPFWRVCQPLRQVMYSMYHLGPDSVESYLEDLNKRKISWIHGYPSTISLLASLIEESGLKVQYEPDFITLGAENLMTSQIGVIQRVFGKRPIKHYGLAEPVANISEWPNGQMAVDEDYAFVELIPVEGIGGTFHVVGTSLYNQAFQFLRYDTGDLVTLADGESPEFTGKPRVVQSIDGRKEDFLRLPDGRMIGRLDHVLKDITEIRESQIRQDRQGSVTLVVVPRSSFNKTTEARVRKEWTARLGSTIPFSIEKVEHIERGPNGKLRFVISDYNPAPIRVDRHYSNGL